jgi:hypothetical protein
MEAKKLINWEHLNNLRYYTSISDHDHLSLDPVLIHNNKKAARAKWQACKKRSEQIRMRFLSERADFMAMKMRTSEEKALRAILQSEASRHTFQKIQDTFGKQQTPLTQVDVISTDRLSTTPHTTLTSQAEIEQNIMERNRHHSLQSLETPFLSNPIPRDAIDPTRGNTKFEEILDGTFLNNIPTNNCISPTERKWIESLKQTVHQEIPLSLSCEDF